MRASPKYPIKADAKLTEHHVSALLSRVHKMICVHKAVYLPIRNECVFFYVVFSGPRLKVRYKSICDLPKLLQE